MILSHGPGNRVIPLYSTRRYRPEEITALIRGVSPPVWLRYLEETILVDTPDVISVVSTLVSAYHNDLVELPPDDGWAEDTARAEEEARAHMEAESSSDDDYVTSDEDLIYENEFYI